MSEPESRVSELVKHEFNEAMLRIYNRYEAMGTPTGTLEIWAEMGEEIARLIHGELDARVLEARMAKLKESKPPPRV
ncbi:MAG: hypothetical protein OXG19_05600 [Chloroflexi bacterium]|nr:hypothetical protein [Chloroflexota bacterium]